MAASLILATAGAAPVYELEPTGSSLKFTATEQSAKFESRFKAFTAVVRFDPAEPGSGRIRAQIDLGSVDTGNPERDAVLKGVDWFNLSQWPEAVFTAEHIVRAGDGYAASGSLALRGVTRPVTFQFRWTPGAADQPARLVGSAGLERLAFGVGQGDWQDTTDVANAVEVQVDIRLRPMHNTDKSVPINSKTPDAK